jgi:hypothetical protein
MCSLRGAPVPEHSFMTSRKTWIETLHPIPSPYSIILYHSHETAAKRTFELGITHDIDLGLNCITLNAVALGCRNFLYFHLPSACFSSPVKWVSVLEMRRTVRMRESQGRELIG